MISLALLSLHLARDRRRAVFALQKYVFSYTYLHSPPDTRTHIAHQIIPLSKGFERISCFMCQPHWVSTNDQGNKFSYKPSVVLAIGHIQHSYINHQQQLSRLADHNVSSAMPCEPICDLNAATSTVVWPFLCWDQSRFGSGDLMGEVSKRLLNILNFGEYGQYPIHISLNVAIPITNHPQYHHRWVMMGGTRRFITGCTKIFTIEMFETFGTQWELDPDSSRWSPEASMLQPVALRNLQPMLGRYSIIDHYYFDCYILLAHKISV